MKPAWGYAGKYGAGPTPLDVPEVLEVQARSIKPAVEDCLLRI